MRVPQRGFTLLEILIALVVFTLMSVMAYQGLRAVLQSDAITRDQGQRLADLQVSLSVLERDLAQVVSRPVRDEFGDTLPPLRLQPGADGKLLELVRAGAGGTERLRRSAWLITARAGTAAVAGCGYCRPGGCQSAAAGRVDSGGPVPGSG